MSELEQAGHIITLDWTVHEAPDGGADGIDGYDPELLASYAMEDVWGVQIADALVAIMERDYPYKGLWVEVGIALGCDILVCILGSAGDSCIFMNHPGVQRFDSLADLCGWLASSPDAAPGV